MATDVSVLVVDDQPENAQLLREAMRLCGLSCELTAAEDGEAALDLLQRSAAGAGKLPHLILLDLNLPGLSGHEVLELIKADLNLRSIPVIVLTTSDAEADIQDTYLSHANAYVIKPAGLEGVLGFVAALRNFWFDVATLPSRDERVSREAAIAPPIAEAPIIEPEPPAVGPSIAVGEIKSLTAHGSGDVERIDPEQLA